MCARWFYPAHEVVLNELLTPATRVVVELGTWLGTGYVQAVCIRAARGVPVERVIGFCRCLRCRSTKMIAKTAFNAALFCVDLWDNKFMLDTQVCAKRRRQQCTCRGWLWMRALSATASCLG